MDQFTVGGKDYLFTVDYYSDYFKVDRLYFTTAKDIIRVLKTSFRKIWTSTYNSD